MEITTDDLRNLRDTEPTVNADLLDALRAAVDAWHDNDENFTREIEEGTPDWLALARTAIARAERGEN